MLVFTVSHQNVVLGQPLGVFVQCSEKSVCVPQGGNRQIGHVLWPAGALLVQEGSCMGGVPHRLM